MVTSSISVGGRGLWGLGLVLVLACGGPPSPEPSPEEDVPRGEASALAVEPPGQGVAPHGMEAVPLQLQPWATGTASVATDGKLYLAVWRDQRSGSIFGTRVTKDGVVLDAAGLLLNPRPRGAFDRAGTVSVAFDGTHFLVVWLGEPYVMGVRVRGDGTLVDPTGFVITQGDDSLEPALACDGRGRCLFVMRRVGDDENDDLLGAFVEGGASSPLLRIAWGPLASPRVAWTGQRFLVVWDEERGEGRDVVGTRVTVEGTVLDTPAFVISGASGHQRGPAVAPLGDVLWVVWQDTRRDAGDIFGARVRDDGTVLDAEGLALSTSSGEQRAPRVAGVDGKVFVLWAHACGKGRSRIRGARVKADGTVINRAGFTVSREVYGREEYPDVACGDGHCLATFLAPLSFPPHGAPVGRFVLGTRLTMRKGALDSPPLALSRAAPAQHFPAVARGNGGSLAVWQEFRDVRGPTLVAARLGPAGQRLDAGGLALPSAPGASHPAVAFDGRQYLVVWQEPHARGEDIRGARVSASGQLLDSVSLPISTAPLRQLAPSVAGGGEGFLVVWEDSRDSQPFSPRFTPFGARVSGSGAVLDAEGLPLAPPGRVGQEPDVVSLGRDFLVAWRGAGIEGTRVSPAGTVLDPEGLALSQPTKRFESSPALSFDGTSALVVWARLGDIFASRVTPGGHVVGPAGFTVSDAPGEQGLPDVTFDGVHHRVVWLEGRGAVSATNPLSIYGARVAPDGTVREPGGVALLPEVFTDYPFTAPPALAGDGRGGALLLHTRFLAEPGVHSLRLVGRRLVE